MHRLLGLAQERYGKVGTSFDVSADLLGLWYATTNQGTGAIEKPVGGSENLYAYKLLNSLLRNALQSPGPSAASGLGEVPPLRILS